MRGQKPTHTGSVLPAVAATPFAKAHWGSEAPFSLHLGFFTGHLRFYFSNLQINHYNLLNVEPQNVGAYREHSPLFGIVGLGFFKSLSVIWMPFLQEAKVTHLFHPPSLSGFSETEIQFLDIKNVCISPNVVSAFRVYLQCEKQESPRALIINRWKVSLWQTFSPIWPPTIIWALFQLRKGNVRKPRVSHPQLFMSPVIGPSFAAWVRAFVTKPNHYYFRGRL